MKIKNKHLLILAIILLLILILQYNYNLRSIDDEKDKKNIAIEIPLGSDMKSIAKLLKEKEIIKNEYVFMIYSKLNSLEDKYKAGIYEIETSMDMKEISDLLQSGKGFIDIVRFTIPEGFELRMIVDRLVEKGLGDKNVYYEIINNEVFEYDFFKKIAREEERLEGYLFPDTYEVYENASEKEIIIKMLDRFDTIFNEKFRNRASELDMSIDNIITLASIIEREAKVDDERTVVSSVFHNRLKDKMLLQSCATVQYIIKERKEILLNKDLEIESPYNTYRNPGLPPGPIASPGLKSIEAALYPDETDYFYFFANDDGSHVFSRTFAEHMEGQKKKN